MRLLPYALISASVAGCATVGSPDAGHGHAHPVADQVIAAQNAQLAASTRGAGFGPQAPRNIDSAAGSNPVVVSAAPPRTSMNLCNIHMHAGAEHAGGEFTKYAGNGDGQGYGSGYLYAGALTASERAPLPKPVCTGKHGGLQSGDTIEVHYVHSNAPVAPGPTLGACLNESIKNPQLRVEAHVFVLVNDANALDFRTLTAHSRAASGYHQATNMPDNLGTPVVYMGSTTGPSYNEKGSPFEATWSVRPRVAKVNIATVGEWCKANAFQEDHAHGVRNLVTQPELLAPIQR